MRRARAEPGEGEGGAGDELARPGRAGRRRTGPPRPRSGRCAAGLRGPAPRRASGCRETCGRSCHALLTPLSGAGAAGHRPVSRRRGTAERWAVGGRAARDPSAVPGPRGSRRQSRPRAAAADIRPVQLPGACRSSSRPSSSSTVPAAAPGRGVPRAGQLDGLPPTGSGRRPGRRRPGPRARAEGGVAVAGAAVVDVHVVGVLGVVEVGEHVGEAGVQAGGERPVAPPGLVQPGPVEGAPAVVAAGHLGAVGQPDAGQVEGPAGVVPGVAGGAAVGPAAVGASAAPAATAAPRPSPSAQVPSRAWKAASKRKALRRPSGS